MQEFKGFDMTTDNFHKGATPINSYEAIGENMWMFWGQFPLNEIVEFELIDYFKAPVVCKRGYYMAYYALAGKDMPSLQVKKGEPITLFITYPAFLTALNMLPAELKIPCLKKYADGKNLYICMERMSKGRLKIHYQEVREPTPEQLVKAKEQYAQIRFQHGGKYE